MAQFCTCGSIMINEQCTNKNCINKAAPAAKPASTRGSRAKSAASTTEKKEAKNTARRASKCVTYNLYDIKKEESAT